MTDLLAQIGTQQLIAMFDLIPDTLFWIKDTDSRLMHVNAQLLRHYGVNSLDQVIGLKDFDFAPKQIASQFVTDDQRVMKGQFVTERLEINVLHSGEFAWFVTSKRALFNDQQEVIGTYGITRHLEQTSPAISGMEAVKAPVEYIKQNYMHDFTIHQLAQTVHLSVSALERRFKKHMNKTPKQFINEVRLENARRMLIETDLPIALVGSECGFADHSYFCRKFAQLFDAVPSVFRKSHQA
ncbi:MAG: AraC-like DNA-binding protein [Phenylobacterium sp.]|jgi:AraC-like DNA-binding protein